MVEHYLQLAKTNMIFVQLHIHQMKIEWNAWNQFQRQMNCHSSLVPHLLFNDSSCKESMHDLIIFCIFCCHENLVPVLPPANILLVVSLLAVQVAASRSNGGSFGGISRPSSSPSYRFHPPSGPGWIQTVFGEFFGELVASSSPHTTPVTISTWVDTD